MVYGELQSLEDESIFILREAAAQFERPAILYSVGKDSSVLLHLARKAFSPFPIPFPLLHIDTGYKFPEMYEFRDRTARELQLRLVVHRNESAILRGAHPRALGTQQCCGELKTAALLEALRAHRIDGAIGGARRDEERSRAKERIFSVRGTHGEWDPRAQRPELWRILNGALAPGQSMRIFPLSNWTELDVWRYIAAEEIPVVSLYFAQSRRMRIKGDALMPMLDDAGPELPGEEIGDVVCRFRTLGCYPCSGAVASGADTIDKIVAEVESAVYSERATRLIDFDADGSMEDKKRAGYF